MTHRWRAALVRGVVLATAAAGILIGVNHGAAVDLGRTESAAVTSNQVSVPTAPMGWASWNSFAAVINYNVIKAQTDAFVAAGLPAAGYQYINIDEGWWQGSRDSSGNITIDTSDWPGGMSAIVNYIHSKGLKAGIYTDAGLNGCGYYYPSGRPAAPNTGSEGHYLQDMTQFENWGFDFVKVDWCGGNAEGLDPQSTYQAISNALASATASTGHPMVLSICEWGNNEPWNWGAGMAAMWRTSTDINDSYSSVLANFDKAQHPTDEHTGYNNDPDMMEVGRNGLTDAQSRWHMGLWAISGAPMLAGNNLATMSSTTASILTNREVIAVDQDTRGLQGVKVAEDSLGLQVYAKVLAGSGKRAVLLLNRTSSAATMTARWADMGLTTASASVRNVWSATTVGSYATSYSTSVPANDSVLLTVTGTEAASTMYEAEASGNTRAGTAGVFTCAACSGGSKVGYIGNGSANTLTFNGVSASATGLAVATIAYTNGESAARTATLKVNGQASTIVAFPPTGGWATPGTVSVIVSLAKGSNTLTFSNSSAFAPDLDAVAITPLSGSNGNEVIGGASGRCLNIDNNTINNDAQTDLWDCAGGVNQSFTYTAGKQLVVYGVKCLGASNNGTANGTGVVLSDCNGQTDQQWNFNSDGTITGVHSGRCLDAYGAGTTNGTKVVIWDCNGQTNQQWSRN